MNLTPKQQAFADYYIQTGNATESAIKAGYSKKTAKEMGCENLTKPHISEYIEAYRSKVAEENRWTVDKLIKRFEEIAEKCESADRIDSSGANKALSEIGKLCGFYTDKVEVTEKHIIVDIEDDEE